MEFKDFIEKFSEAIEIENIESLTPDTDFRQLSEWSSISVLLTIAFYDEEFGKEIGDSEIEGCRTLDDLYNLAKN